MTYYSVSAFINFSLSLLLGLFIFYKNPRVKINRAMFFWCLTVAFWSFFYFLWQIESKADLALLWTRLLMLGAVWVPLGFLLVVLIFLELEKKKFYRWFIRFIIVLSAIFSGFLATPLMVSHLDSVGGFQYWPMPGFVYHFFLTMFLGVSAYSTYLTFMALRTKLTGIKRLQIKYMLFGITLSIIGGSTNYFLWYGIPIKPYGNAFASTYIILTAYAIIAHRLMDIKLVMRRYSVYLASLSLILILAVAVKYAAESWFYDYSVWADPLLLIGAIYVFTPIKNYFYRLANKYFFSSLYDSAEVIASLSDKLRTTLEAEKIYEFISQTLAGAFHAKAIGLLIYNEKAGNFAVQNNSGFNIGSQKIFPEDKELNEMFIRQNKPVITEDIRRLSRFDDNQTVALLKKLGVEILAPLNVKDKIIGLIALGAKESGDMYNDEDLKVLEVVGAQTAIAMENALLYKETKDFSIKLEKEVEKATRDLRKANAQLKKLDAAKSEFISIASHQLRTPLTVIKGYISMMLEGNFGGLTKPESESLEKVFESNERLIQLVENLLNISRIESGRLQFNYQQVDMNNMVASVKEELAANAKKKGLILQYKAPAKPVPTIKLDDEKIRQVVMNLMDNGIKYTKQGSVTVKLEQKENKIQFCVTDSGMGIRPEDMGNLFKKFSRGSGTSLIHTEGTGLGLYVARMMIEAHHGRIWAESGGEGKGSKFCFELPVK